jgi:hypothetical protein
MLRIVRMGLAALVLSMIIVGVTNDSAFAEKKGKKPNISKGAREANKFECDVLNGEVSAEGVETQENGSRWGYIDCDFSSGDIDVCRWYDNGERTCASVKITPSSGGPRGPRATPSNLPSGSTEIDPSPGGQPRLDPRSTRERAEP